MIDSDSNKMQGFLDNSILTSEYGPHDVLGEPDPLTNSVRDKQWHLDYMKRLSDHVIDILDSSDDIPAFLNDE